MCPRKRSTNCVTVDGQRLREIRQSIGWTQEQAAFSTGYSDRLIRKLEKGGSVALRTLIDVLDTYREQGVDPRLVEIESIVKQHSRSELELFAREWFDRAFRQRDANVVDEMFHPQVVVTADGQTTQGREVVRQRIHLLLSAFRPLIMEFEHLFFEGDAIVVYWKAQKRHTGEFRGIPATGRWVTSRGSSLAFFRDGQIVEVRDHWDLEDVIQQLSLLAD